MKAKPSKISPQTRAAVAAILDADKGLSPMHRLSILSACDNAPGIDPGPVAGAEMPLQDAALILGKSLPTLIRWIEAGRLEGRQFGNRLWLVSAASVETMRASLAAPARQGAPLPDRLAHLAGRTTAISRRG